MVPSNIRSRQGHRLLQIGVALFLFTSFEGFAVPYFGAPNLGRSVHTLSAFSGVLLLALGLTWPRLRLGPAAAQIAFWSLIYSHRAPAGGRVNGREEPTCTFVHDGAPFCVGLGFDLRSP